MKHPTLIGIAMALCAAALWGTTGTAQSLVASQISPYWVGALRLAIASAFFAACVLLGRSGHFAGGQGYRTVWRCWREWPSRSTT